MNNQLTIIEDNIKNNNILILKFDNEDSKYNEYFNNYGLNYKSITITDKDIIDFYEIDVLPSIYIYKHKNLLGTIEGFHSKTVLLKKIIQIIDNQ